ncbi:metal-dependent transcriptional regulator [Haladaptatus cibarius]|uniref:metal-dependent transcriptional regulator n=1 Tax=Haladaptatus cibarius TaxID=453847 RepID=UPI0006787CF8|nr:metal-dependent transcriptional regulator [Haladaptatus cibarius]
MVTPKVEDYLKAIYSLQDDHAPVAPSAIATELGVTPPTVTRMLNQLQDDELVVYEKYQGASLTENGEKIARTVVRRHRLLELFLTEEFGYDWTEVHEEADVLEHHISEKLESRIADKLDNPTADPHGAPIPTEELKLPTNADDCFLTECEVGDKVVIKEVHENTADVLTYFADIGVVPGAVIRVTEVAPIGTITIHVRNTKQSSPLTQEIAATIRVISADREDSAATEQIHEVT